MIVKKLEDGRILVMQTDPGETLDPAAAPEFLMQAEDETPFMEGQEIKIERVAADAPCQTRGKLPAPIGVGSPAVMKLHRFAQMLYQTYGVYPILVGSALTKKEGARDIDLRLVLKERQFRWAIGPTTQYGRPQTAWAHLCEAWTALGREITGLNIDFQFQTEDAAKHYEYVEYQPAYEIGRPGAR